jgi:hypothetical protein
VTQCDIENFIVYFGYVLSAASIPEKLEFNRNLIQAFIGRAYAGLKSAPPDYRVERLYGCIYAMLIESC